MTTRQAETAAMEVGGYFPGAIGQITSLHATYYHQHWGLDVSFESQVGGELSNFLAQFDPARDVLITARQEGRLMGAIAIDGHSTPDQGARLRWFIVEPGCQGQGLGRMLMGRALELARRAGHQRVYLWTFAGLEAARRLYEEAGFRLTQEHRVEQWGNVMDEQRLDLELAGGA